MAMSKIMRSMTQDGSARVIVTDTTGIVREVQRIHGTTPLTTAALGRLVTAASMIGSMMGEKQESVTLGVRGDGPIGQMIAVSDYYGNVRGYAENPSADLPLRADGKINVGAGVGAGILYVARDSGKGEPQTGMIALKSGEIAEDVAAYYAESEQIPTVCSLGVLVGRDRTVTAAGGILIQLLPFADEETVTKLEENAKNLPPVSGMVSGGMTPEEITAKVLEGIPYDPYDTIGTDYLCTCTRERMERGIRSLGEKEIESVFAENEREGKGRVIETVCRFCNKTYSFTEGELK